MAMALSQLNETLRVNQHTYSHIRACSHNINPSCSRIVRAWTSSYSCGCTAATLRKGRTSSHCTKSALLAPVSGLSLNYTFGKQARHNTIAVPGRAAVHTPEPVFRSRCPACANTRYTVHRRPVGRVRYCFYIDAPCLTTAVMLAARNHRNSKC